jgi:N-acetyl-1-D-myo-inositol-2-amino-2-deoxy-alpha-D-glucopyranoside deacetylase
MNVMASLRPASVLAVYAHPDDELFHGGGMLAHLANRGVSVVLTCATKGEAGKPHPIVGQVTDLGAHRAEELRRSCALLGLGEPVFLGFHDSARHERVRRDDPLALVNVDMLEVEAAINRVIQDIQPQVIVTFDPHGGYYHPDHVAVHRATTAAFYSSGALGAKAPERLFYSAFTVDDFLEHKKRSEGWGVTAGLDAYVFAVSAEMVACEFDARPYMDRMFAAFAAHQSAFGTTREMLDSPPPEQAKRLHAFRVIMEHEVFTLGAARGAIARWPLIDLVDDLVIRAAS